MKHHPISFETLAWMWAHLIQKYTEAFILLLPPAGTLLMKTSELTLVPAKLPCFTDEKGYFETLAAPSGLCSRRHSIFSNESWPHVFARLFLRTLQRYSKEPANMQPIFCDQLVFSMLQGSHCSLGHIFWGQQSLTATSASWRAFQICLTGVWGLPWPTSPFTNTELTGCLSFFCMMTWLILKSLQYHILRSLLLLWGQHVAQC